MATAGIYEIRNINNGRCYYGSAIDVRRREYEHRKCLNGGYHGNGFLQRSWRKHGESAFVFSVLEIITDHKDLIPREQVYLDLAFSGTVRPYNICPTAGSLLGTRRSTECRARLSAMAVGRIISPEARKKISISNSGKVRTSEHQAKLTMARIGFRHTAETKAKISASKQGTIHSDEWRAKVSATKKGKPVAQSHRDALRDANRSLSVEQVSAIVSRRKAGESYKSIAKDYPVTKDTIRNWCIKEGLEQTNPYVTPEQIADIQNRRAAGQTYEQIAQGTGICEVTIWRKLTGKDQSKSSKAAKAALAVQPADDRTLFDDLGTD